MDVPPLDSVNRGFRERYLDYGELTEQLRAWAHAYPSLVRLESLGTTPQGRELWVVTIGPEPERVRPAVWVDGNLHAVELAGSSVALAIAEEAIRLHLEGEGSAGGESAAVREAARPVLFHVMPRISPDGAEAVLKTGQYVRSVPRDARPNRQHARWRAGDVDGDGVALAMRIEDPAGEYVESADCPGLMLERTIHDSGPFYRVYPEGFVENFDGQGIPDPGYLDDNSPDLNRNFPFQWVPEPEQEGAGPFPASEPESRAIVEFAAARPNLFAWFNLHTFGGVYIRPRAEVPDEKMDRSDLALYRQLEAWAEELTGYSMVSGYEEFTYEPGKPLHGDLTDFAYHQRGCLAMVCELWDLFAQLGIPRRKPFVDHYTHTTAEDLIRLARWDREQNAGRVIRPWRRVNHPQLGEV
ncbi:MAG: M14 family metallopeptidase, partial [Ectothiorhodospiraceae bacterium]